VPRIVRVPTPAEPTQTTGGTAAQQTQDAPDSAAPTSRAAASAVPAAATPAAMPPLQASRQREAPWSASRPWDPNATDSEQEDEGVPAACSRPASRKPLGKASSARQSAKGRGTAQAAAAAPARPAGQLTAAAAKPQPKPAAARSQGRKRAAADAAASQENQDPVRKPGPVHKRQATGDVHSAAVLGCCAPAAVRLSGC
jgi:hypothetical protein